MTIAITPAADEDVPYIRDLYLFSFPDNERIGFDEILRIKESGFGEVLVAKNGDTRVGMMFILKGEGLIYIYYLAVDPGMRGLGYGSSVLDGLKAIFPGCRFALSSESPDPDARNLEERLWRISFYERNGFADSGRRDMWKGERYALLTYGGDVGRDETGAMFRKAERLGKKPE